jgi:hypothetical protein
MGIMGRGSIGGIKEFLSGQTLDWKEMSIE